MRDLSKPQRQALAGVGVMFFRNLRVAINLFIVLLIPILSGNKEEKPYLNLMIYGLIILILLFMAILAWFQYRRFYFQVINDKFQIHKGVFRRDMTTVPFDRIQSVQLKQNLVQRILGVVGIAIDTAGSGKEEVGIPALSRSYAEDLKAYLLAKKKEVVEGETLNESIEEEQVKEPVLHLGIQDLLKVGLTENHIRTGLISLAVVFSYFSQYAEYFGQDVEETTRQVVDYGRQLILVLPLFLIAFVVLSILLSTIRTALGYFDLKLWLDSQGLRVISGLLKRQESVIPAHKIQFIRWKTNPLRRMIGYYSLSVYQATSANRDQTKSVQIPGCRKAEISRVSNAFFPLWEGESNSTEVRPHSFFFRRLWLYTGWLPGILVFLVLLFGFPLWIPIAIAMVHIPLSGILGWKYYQRRVIWIGKEVMALDKGYVFSERSLLNIYKVQNLMIRQSIWQKRRGLVSLTLFTAAGSLNIPYIREELGREWADRILFHVESSKKDWM